MSDWFTIRQQARRDIHAQFALLASYSDANLETPATGLHVRWQSRFTAAVGDIPGGDYARLFENIDRLIFDIQELIERSLVVRRGGLVIFDQYPYQFTLDVLEPTDGPVWAIWTVTRP